MTQRKPPDDSELQALYRAAAQAAGDEPDARLDARILAAARAASGERQARRQRPPAAWWKRWLVPVSVTAVAVLGVSLSFRVNEEQAALEAARQVSEAVTARQAPPAATTARPEPAPLPVSPPTLLRAKPAAESPAPPAAELPPPRAPRDRPAEVGAASEEKARRELAPSAPAPATFGQARSPTLDDRASSAAKAAAELRESSARRSRAIESDQALGAGAPASGLNRQSLTPPRQNEEATALEASPERWLERIRDLRRANRPAEAQQELDRFRQRYPDFALPADLK